MTRLEEVLDELTRRLTPDELEELASRLTEVEVRPHGSWGNRAPEDPKGLTTLYWRQEDDDEPSIDVTVYHGHHDGRPVIQIDTGESAVAFRVNVNDGPIWDADPTAHQHTRCHCIKEEA